MTVGVIISTYNHPEWLEKVLWGYLCQTVKADEIIIADDGSTQETTALIKQYSNKLPIKHIWHEDRGFRKPVILNKAILASNAMYLVFTDQDCVPRADFIETHLKHARKGFFLSAGYFMLPLSLSKKISSVDIESQQAFSLNWLKKNGLKCSFKCSKLLNVAWFSKLMNAVTPTNASWNGCNASGWRDDIIAVNGFNNSMTYGGEDREFGERLFNSGIKSKQIRYSAIVLHLDHLRPYKTEEAIRYNKNIWKNTIRMNTIICPDGIKQL